mgnify:CR=1 FL=1
MVARAKLIGRRFSRLTVLEYSGSRSGKSAWSCLCDCGQTSIATSASLIGGKVKSCGCLRRDTAEKMATTHGATRGANRTAEYTTWTTMRQRCTNPKARNYDIYGGRDITVCNRWDSFENFLADMGPRPSPKHSIDRFPDNDGNYEPGNCRWATWKEQARNRSTTRFIQYAGQSKPLWQWCEELGLNYKRTVDRFRKGWTAERAFTQIPRLAPR